MFHTPSLHCSVWKTRETVASACKFAAESRFGSCSTKLLLGFVLEVLFDGVTPGETTARIDVASVICSHASRLKQTGVFDQCVCEVPRVYSSSTAPTASISIDTSLTVISNPSNATRNPEGCVGLYVSGWRLSLSIRSFVFALCCAVLVVLYRSPGLPAGNLYSSGEDMDIPAFAEGSDSDEEENVQLVRRKRRGEESGRAGATKRRQIVEISSDGDDDDASGDDGKELQVDLDIVNLCNTGSSGGDDDSDADSSDANENPNNSNSNSSSSSRPNGSSATITSGRFAPAARKPVPTFTGGQLAIPPFRGGRGGAEKGAAVGSAAAGTAGRGGGGSSAVVDLALSSDSDDSDSDSSDSGDGDNFIPLTRAPAPPRPSAASLSCGKFKGSSQAAGGRSSSSAMNVDVDDDEVEVVGGGPGATALPAPSPSQPLPYAEGSCFSSVGFFACRLPAGSRKNSYGSDEASADCLLTFCPSLPLRLLRFFWGFDVMIPHGSVWFQPTRN